MRKSLEIEFFSCKNSRIRCKSEMRSHFWFVLPFPARNMNPIQNYHRSKTFKSVKFLESFVSEKMCVRKAALCKHSKEFDWIGGSLVRISIFKFFAVNYISTSNRRQKYNKIIDSRLCCNAKDFLRLKYIVAKLFATCLVRMRDSEILLASSVPW
jgi:hypothetical protein